MRRTITWTCLFAVFCVAAALPPVARAARSTAERAARGQRERELMETIRSDDASWEQIDRACRELRRIGTRDCIPVLAELLTEEKYSHMARYALEPMPYPEADRALRGALDEAEGEVKVGIINSLAFRQDAEAVPLLIPLLEHDNTAIAEAAAAALGRVATPRAVRALRKLRASGPEEVKSVAAHASLAAAERLVQQEKPNEAAEIYNGLRSPEWPERVRRAAFVGLLNAQPDRAVSMVLDAIAGEDRMLRAVAIANIGRLKGEGVIERLAAELPELAPADQVVLIEALAEEGDPSARKAILRAGQASEGKVRAAAARALAEVGNADCVAWLAEVATAADTAEEQDAASRALVVLEGDAVTDALEQAMREADPAARPTLITLLMKRNDPDTVDALMEQADGPTVEVRQAALRALARLAGPDRLPALIDLLLESPDDAARREAEKTVAEVAGKIPDEKRRADAVLDALADADGVVDRCSLLRVLGGIGGSEALSAVRDALGAGAEPVRDAAVRALASWPDAGAAPALLELFRSTDNATHRELALRGLVRVLERASDLSPARMAAVYDLAAAAVRNAGQKRLLLSGVMRVAHPHALEIAMRWLGDRAVQREAATAAVTITERILAAHPEVAKASMKRVAGAVGDRNVVNRARALMQKVGRLQDYIAAWQVAGPYSKRGRGAPQLFDTAFPPEQDAGDADWSALPVRSRSDDRPWMLDLAGTLGGEQCLAYVRTWVHADDKTPARLEMGVDDTVKAWLNGELVHASSSAGAARPGEEKADVTLKEGWNLLMLKIVQHTGPWEFCARLRTRDGKPLEGLRVDPDHGTAAADGDIFGPASPPDAPGWEPLFNGRDLSGWSETGDAIFKVEDGRLVGTQTNGKGGDLWHERELSDFELRAVYRVEWPANSGFWFRHDGRRGYQFDVLQWPNPIAYSGSLYCPGKLFVTRNLDRTLENRDGWNEARVRADGDELTLWLNGVLVGHCRDDTLDSGRVGLQVHPGENFKGMKIVIKTLEVRDLADGGSR